MDWFHKTKADHFPDDSVSVFWQKVGEMINPFNPTLHYGLINEHLEQLTFIHGHVISLDDIYISSKLMSCKSWSKLLTSKTRPYHITRWFMHVFSLFPDPSFEFYESRIVKIDGRLIKAIESNDLKLFEILLELVDVNARSTSTNGACPIHIAALLANQKALELLLERGADLEMQDKEGLTPIFYAVQSKSLEIFYFLKEKGANLFHVEKQGRTLFYWTASLGRMELLDVLLQAGLDPNATTKLGRTALSKSAWNGSVDIMRYLLKLKNIQIEVKDKNGRTALHNAVWGSAGGREGKKMGQNATDSPECAELLISHGADLEAVDNAGNTPLCIACSTYSPSSLSLLLKKGANLYHVDKKGLNPYHQAVARKNLDIAETLLALNVPVDIPSPKWSCLQICIRYKEEGSLEWLLDKGIKPNIQDYIFALERPNLNALKILVKRFGVPEKFDQLAFQHGDLQTCIFALEVSEVTEESLLCALKKDKALAEIALNKWTGPVTSAMIEKMMDFKIDPSPFLSRAQPTSSILRLAIRQRCIDLAMKILEKYPEFALEADSYSGNTALHIACQSNFNEIIPKLISIAPDPISYILQTNKKEMSSILICQTIKFRLSIAELLKNIVNESQRGEKFSEIKAMEYSLNPHELTPHPLKDSMPVGYWHNTREIELKHETPYTWIDTKEGLDLMISRLEGFSIIGVDLEYHLYEPKIGVLCLVQISNGLEDFIIDALVNRDYLGSTLQKLIDNPNIIKVLHGGDSDLFWLQNDFDLHPVRIFDTARAHKIIKNESQLPSLANLLKLYFGLQIDKSFKISEWRIRPLPLPMIDYARTDAHYLIELYKTLMNLMSEEQILELSESCNKLSLKTPEKRFIRITIKE
jgi:ankyrin repeat protein